MTDPVLVVAWLVLAHLIADFVLQNDWIAMNKGRAGGSGWAALSAHGAHVGLCLLPAVFAFGPTGLLYAAVIVASHMAVDRWKVRATKQAEARAQANARRQLEAGAPPRPTSLGVAWTPVPGLLFLADQVLHLIFALVGWLVIMAGASLTGPFVDTVNAGLRDWDRASVHAFVLTTVVLLSLFIANTRGAFYFVLSLTSPRHLAPVDPAAAPPEPSSLPTGAALQISTTILALERLLIVAVVLARARQLEDRAFADYHLLGSLASLSVALGSALLAQAALHTLG
jgi:hypothetical protein